MSKHRNDENRNTDIEKLANDFGASARPIVTVDVEKYQSYLDNSGLSEAQKEEFLQALWSIIVDIVDFGFGVHPLQEVCGKDSGECSLFPSAVFNQVSSDQSEEPEKPIISSRLGGLEVT